MPSSKNTVVSVDEAQKTALTQSRKEQLQVIATLSHELRTPLHAIMGLSELLQSEQMSSLAKRHVDKIHVASNGLLDSLNKAIEAARSESNSLIITPVTTDITQLMEQSVKTYSIAAEGKGLELALMVDPKLYGVSVELDGIHLQQVLNNLIGNAIKFTDKGSIEVWAALKNQSDSFLEIFFSVIDSGIGIDSNDLEKVLTPFGQVETMQKGRPLGSGLGLSICTKIVQKMGGHLNLKSELGKGTNASFQLTFPMSKSQPPVPHLQFRSEPVIALVARKSVKFEIIETFLLEWGATVIKAESFKQLANRNIDALLVSEELAIQQRPECEDWKPQLTQGRIGIIRCENSPFPPDLIDGISEFFEPVLPSELHGFFANSGLTDLIAQQVRVKQDNPLQNRMLRVLAVDDSVTNLILLKSQLAKLGNVEVDLANNGKEAIDKIESGDEFHLVFMDFNMPMLTGPEATKLLREKGYDLPIIGLTALDDVSIESTKTSHLFNDILNKPTGLSVIQKVVDSARMHQYQSVKKLEE